MTEESFKRKLTAILSADVEGYSRLMGEDEDATIRTLTSYRELMSTLIQKHRGRVVDSPGDNLLAEFLSVVDAVRCAVEVQEELRVRNAELSENRRMEFRIGINLGDVVQEEERIYGDGINIAARVEGLAEGGGICISGTVYDSIKNKLSLSYESLGEHTVKNITEPVRVYRMRVGPEAAARPRPRYWHKAALAALVVLIVAAGAWAIWNFYFRPPPIEPASVEKMAYPLPDKPSIAVLPFVNMSGDAKQEYLADGITENVITALSKVPEIFVIARNSVFTYKGKPVKIRQVSEELGVQYVLEGSVQKSDGRLRITAQLIDATGGHHLWADRFDRDLKDIFAVQDEVTLNILSALRVEFTHGEQARVQETTDNLEAWSYVVKGVSHFESFTKDDNARAQELFERAVKVDPKYSYAWAMLGWTHWFDATYGYSASRSESFKKAVEIAQKAMGLDDAQPDVHALMGGIYLIQRQYANAIAEGERAIAIAPNVACNKAILAQTMLFAGSFEETITLVKRAMRLNPYYPSWYLQPLAMAYTMIGDHEKAIALNEKLLNRRKEAGGNIITPLLGLAANSIFLGREDEAKAYVKEILEVEPNFSLERFQKVNFFKDPLQLKATFEALRRAGLPERPPLPLPDKPSIAVLPFVNMSEDPKQEYFSDGITEEIITALSKTPKLFVIARNSTFTYKGKPVKVQQVGRELGVKYVLEGSVRKAGDKVRITAQLVDVKTGHHLWAERYERELKDIFALQDEITMKIITALQVKLTEGEQAHLLAKGTDNLGAYLKLLQGREHFYHMNKEDNALGRQLIKEAISLDPEYANAYAFLATTHLMDMWLGTSKSPRESLAQAIKLAQKSIALDDSYATAHALLGNLYTMTRQHDKGIAECERAVALDPNSATAHAWLGTNLYWADRPEDAIPLLKKAIHLNPIPPPWYLSSLAMAYRDTGRYEESISACRKALNREPRNVVVHLALAATYVLSGHEEEARAEAAEILRIDPKFSLERLAKTRPHKNQANTERFIDSLRKAGLK
ncbi:MAG: tetratricopeptide repeat protein [Desulfobacteraceae bacterium]|nr:tetratricopeptide repeat protein [Desulfobacteraceae bacterium]